MANSKYEYVKSFEVEDEVFMPNLVVIRIDGRDFLRFTQEYPDIVFSYGYSDENSKMNKYSSHLSICCASIEVLQAYLAWRQNDCHINNQYETCLGMLVKCGKTESEAQEILKGTQKQEKNELLFQQFGINYKKLPELFRQRSCVFKTEVEDIVKYNENGAPVKRLRRKTRIVHSENIAGKKFWNEHPCLVKELGGFEEDVSKIKPDYVRSYLFESKLMPYTWIVIRIDGCHFHRFSEVHEFEKPNDKRALNLMNSCAVAVLEEFQDITFSYGASDEYSFVLNKETLFYQRRASDIVSVIVSFFTSMYVMKWKEFFPHKDLKYPPSFDGRAVCYPSSNIIRDYLAWRQVDCHINNQYNTCFWMLVMSGKSKSEAEGYSKHERRMNCLYKNLVLTTTNCLSRSARAEKTMAFENGPPAMEPSNDIAL
ncbi:hypothetical protein Q3G72_010367 [Acer saccharum]|nr:hypothetical protein Q3G72_010367 [Acer saccharum]